MLDKILKITGTAALYGFSSLFLASLILGTYLAYAWNIDKSKRNRMLAIAQGHDLTEIQKAVEQRVAEMSFEDVLELRAKRLREEEFKRDSSEKNVTELMLADEKRIDAKIARLEKLRKDYDDHVKKSTTDAKAAGLAEQTRIIEAAEPEFAKDIILGIIKDFGDTRRVLEMLLAMEEKNRDEILFAMEGEEELKELVVLLQKIGNGEPLADVLNEADRLSRERNPESNSQ